MTNTASAPAPSLHPDPNRAVSARLDCGGTGNILRLLRTLFAYGSNLVQTLRQEYDPDDIPWYPFLTRLFGTTNPALITVTIIRGLLRITVLQARLSKSAATLLPLPLREDRAAKRIDGGRGPRQAGRWAGPRQPSVVGWTMPPGWPAADHSLGREPTYEEEMFAEIVEEDRDRPLGPILLDICLDLGIVPDLMDRSTWDELHQAITLYGGDPTPLLARAMDSADPAVRRKTPDLIRGHSATGTSSPTDNSGVTPILATDSTTADPPPNTAIVYPPWPAPYPQYPAAACTGPP